MANTGCGARLDGRVAVITGGRKVWARRSPILFARARRKRLDASAGATPPTGRRVAEKLNARGCATHYVQADLGNVEDCRNVVAAADAKFGRVDALVNAAALTDRGSIWDTSAELWDRIFAVNVRAPFFLMQECAKIMRREKIAGTMVNILSMSAHGGQPFITAYCSSKGALLTLTKNIAFSLLRQRIRVNGLNIGWMDTPGEDRIMRTYHDAQDGWRSARKRRCRSGGWSRSTKSRARWLTCPARSRG